MLGIVENGTNNGQVHVVFASVSEASSMICLRKIAQLLQFVRNDVFLYIFKNWLTFSYNLESILKFALAYKTS